ncbi:hypothetical protein [Mycolicibacterium goodii]|uniref:hypothetical protein n=1 Tax=Mycolicibacterium goodii TaxID=134601 RepID=UPI00256E9D8B|nr:hypothetical protein [Mycolicibacterium goodii]
MLQVLSLAATDPTYQPYAHTAVTVMLDPIARALVGLGYPRAEADVRASLVVSALRGLCQDRIVTGTRAASTLPPNSSSPPPSTRRPVVASAIDRRRVIQVDEHRHPVLNRPTIALTGPDAEHDRIKSRGIPSICGWRCYRRRWRDRVDRASRGTRDARQIGRRAGRG